MDINLMLYNICQDEHVYDDNFDLIESGVMDSYALIELISLLEENDIFLEPSNIKISNLRTPKNIKELINETTFK